MCSILAVGAVRASREIRGHFPGRFPKELEGLFVSVSKLPALVWDAAVKYWYSQLSASVLPYGWVPVWLGGLQNDVDSFFTKVSERASGAFQVTYRGREKMASARRNRPFLCQTLNARGLAAISVALVYTIAGMYFTLVARFRKL